MDTATHQTWLALLTAPRALAPGIRDGLAAGAPPADLLQRARQHARGAQGDGAAACRAWLASDTAAATAQAQGWIEAGEQRGLLTCTDPRWPERFAELPGLPIALYWAGDLDLLAHPQLAIVGSRNPTPAGGRIARRLSAALAEAGLGITSGLASGIDTCAHLGALSADGITVAVCGRGLDDCYPASNRKLAAQIAQRGLLLSAYTPGTPPARGHFPARNRIIAALSRGTLVVEATLNSGSLITARQAREFGREVFAVPGSIDNALARGGHQLLREGATLVESPRDVLEALAGDLLNSGAEGPVAEGGASRAAVELEPSQQRLLKALDDAPTTVDELVSRTGLPAADVSSMLLILELQGIVATAPDGGYQRIAPRT